MVPREELLRGGSHYFWNDVRIRYREPSGRGYVANICTDPAQRDAVLHGQRQRSPINIEYVVESIRLGCLGLEIDGKTL